MNNVHNKNTRLLLASGAMFSVLIIVLMGFWYLNIRAMNRAYNPDVKRPWDDPEIAAALSRQRLERAKFLRTKYAVWASLHRDQIQKMRQASDYDQAPDALWRALPSDIRQPNAGLPSREWVTGDPIFSWDAAFRDVQSDSKAVDFEEMRKYSETEHRKQFEKYKDIIISSSVHPGPSKVALWASGRITEESIIENPNPTSGAAAFIRTPSKELVPAFDFSK